MKENHALIDWVSFSLPEAYAPLGSYGVFKPLDAVVQELFGLDISHFEHTQKKLNFYRRRYTLNTKQGNPLLHIFCEPDSQNNKDTTLFMVTGYALSGRSDALTSLDPIALLRAVKKRAGRLTRIDLALDDFSGNPLLAQMIDACRPDVWRDRTITTLCRTGKPVAIWDETLYFGNRSKGSCICAYNKQAQQGTDYPWFRCEFSTRDRDLCVSLLDEIVAGVPIGKLAAGTMRHYLRFVPPGQRAKGTRTPCRWWTDFLSEGAQYELRRQISGKTEEGELKEKQAPAKRAVLRYLTEALRLDTSGEVAAAITEIFSGLQLAEAFR